MSALYCANTPGGHAHSIASARGGQAAVFSQLRREQAPGFTLLQTYNTYVMMASRDRNLNRMKTMAQLRLDVLARTCVAYDRTAFTAET